MKATVIAIMAAAGLVAASGTIAFGQGASDRTPGHEMQQKGSKGEPGASYYAPGQKMQRKGSKKGSPGASGYAPGHTSGQNTTTRKKKH
jgi:hypothetical protein